MDTINRGDLLLFGGLVCCNTTVYPKVPECIGYSGFYECLCLNGNLCAKAGTSAYPLGFNQASPYIAQFQCICAQFGIMNKFTTCCKSQNQCCCVVQQCAFPPDGDVPITLAMLFVALYPKLGVCTKLSECTYGGGAPVIVQPE